MMHEVKFKKKHLNIDTNYGMYEVRENRNNVWSTKPSKHEVYEVKIKTLIVIYEVKENNDIDHTYEVKKKNDRNHEIWSQRK